MKRFLLVALLVATPSLAADLTVTIPATAIANAAAQCDRQRVLLGIRPAEWTNDVCATLMVRIGLRVSTNEMKNEEGQLLVEATQSTANNNTQSAMNVFDTNFPLPVTSAACGDGATDVFDDFNEQCDDGNQDNTDACTTDCETATCGDGYVQAGVEECDDGNTDDGDGCSATCTTE